MDDKQQRHSHQSGSSTAHEDPLQAVQSVRNDDRGPSVQTIDMSTKQVVSLHAKTSSKQEAAALGEMLGLALNAEKAKDFEKAERLYLSVDDGWLRARDMWIKQGNLREAIRLMQQHLQDKQEREEMVKQFVLKVASNEMDADKAVRKVETFVGPEDAVLFAVSRKSWAVAIEISMRSVPKMLLKVFVMQSSTFVESGNYQKAVNTFTRGNFHLAACHILGVLGQWEEASKLAAKETKRLGKVSAKEWVAKHRSENERLRSVNEEILSMESNENSALLVEMLRGIVVKREEEETDPDVPVSPHLKAEQASNDGVDVYTEVASERQQTSVQLFYVLTV